jgi:hypothetical protein
MALAAFVLAFGPLPGVPQPPGKLSLIPDGTIAADWALAVINEVTPEQRAAQTRSAHFTLEFIASPPWRG